MKTYAAYSREESIRKVSSSGGIFLVLAFRIISMEGIVYGVAMSEDCYYAEYIRVDKIDGLSRLKGSKYLQAKVNNTFLSVEKDLKEGKRVLFTGTPCQINGLKSFLQKEYEKLICIDVICHGVPSPVLWKKYVLDLEKKHGKLKTVNFRCKDNGWIDYGIKENSLYISKDKDTFMQMFLRDYSLRPSCYSCDAKRQKFSDITIADFWGIENVAPEMNDNKGCSLVLLRTKKGEGIFDNVKDDLIRKKVKYEDVIKYNKSEYTSVMRPAQRETFFIDMNRLTYKKLSNKYIKGPMWKRIGRKIKTQIKKLGGAGDRIKSIADFGMLLSFEKESKKD